LKRRGRRQEHWGAAHQNMTAVWGKQNSKQDRTEAGVSNDEYGGEVMLSTLAIKRNIPRDLAQTHHFGAWVRNRKVGSRP
jgi:hypothetical protein